MWLVAALRKSLPKLRMRYGNNVRVKIIMSVALATVSVGAGAESIINEHSTDIVNLLTWLLAGVGGAFITLLVAFFALRLDGIDKKFDRIEKILMTEINSVKADARQDRLRIHAVELDSARARERMRIAGVPQPVDYVQDGE